MVQSERGETVKVGGVRLSITIPAEDYSDIRTAADQKHVSIAWVVRDALRQYLKDQAPLFRQ